MKKKEVIQFLQKFQIEEEIINKLLKNKETITVNKNTFLTKKENLPLPKNQIYTDNIIFIQLETLLPSQHLLQFISKHTKPIQIKNEKQALNFTYGKSLKLESLIKKHILVDNQYYIVKFDENILGYCQFNQEKKQIINLMNIGEYLKEN